MNQATRRILLNPPPPRNEQVQFQRSDGSWCNGWATYDALYGWRYFTRSIDAPLPSKVTSRWDIEGVLEIFPLAWRPYVRDRVTVPASPVSRRETEIILRRAVLTDGTLRRSGLDRLHSMWDKIDSRSTLAYVDQVGLEIFTRFVPEPFDRDNYLVGMDWLARINKKAKGFGDLNQEQNAVVWRAYDYSFEWIGEEILGNVSRQRAQTVYRSAVDRAWTMAAANQAEIRRLPRPLWEK